MKTGKAARSTCTANRHSLALITVIAVHLHYKPFKLQQLSPRGGGLGSSQPVPGQSEHSSVSRASSSNNESDPSLTGYRNSALWVQGTESGSVGKQ
jgi:hypothetical protein